jgi:hypothetical protein
MRAGAMRNGDVWLGYAYIPATIGQRNVRVGNADKLSGVINVSSPADFLGK